MSEEMEKTVVLKKKKTAKKVVKKAKAVVEAKAEKKPKKIKAEKAEKSEKEIKLPSRRNGGQISPLNGKAKVAPRVTRAAEGIFTAVRSESSNVVAIIFEPNGDMTLISTATGANAQKQLEAATVAISDVAYPREIVAEVTDADLDKLPNFTAAELGDLGDQVDAAAAEAAEALQH